MTDCAPILTVTPSILFVLSAEVVKLADTPSASTRSSDRSYLAEKQGFPFTIQLLAAESLVTASHKQ
jgi:hypothetical protein